jgi:hypothetical protein
MTKDEALKLALEAITTYLSESPDASEEAVEGLWDAVNVARKALAQPEQPEPPPWWPAVENILKEYGLQAIDFVADFKKALAQPEQKPMAWMDADGNVSDNNDHDCFPIPLYTFPPRRTWVGLTVEEVAYFMYVLDHWTTTHIRGIEAKLKEKNT